MAAFTLNMVSATEWMTKPMLEFRLKHLACWKEHMELYMNLYPTPNTTYSKEREMMYVELYKQLSCQQKEKEKQEQIPMYEIDSYERISREVDQEIEDMLSDSGSDEFEITITKKIRGAADIA
jgi:hypothetical protein